MATIFTVHGTFASGPTEGDEWWQHGSVFEHDLRRYVEAEDGYLNVEPFVWSGENSETARRKAGTELHKKLLTHEEKGELYSIIGHSHGGSVAGHGVISSARKKKSLKKLSRWISVGTPFIETKRQRLTLFRLGDMGRVFYLLVLLIFWIFFSAIVSFSLKIQNEFMSEIMLEVFFFSLVVVPVSILIFIVTKFVSGRSILDKKKLVRLKGLKSINRKWIALWHQSDEAIASLRAIDSTDLKPFKKDFLLPFSSVFSIVILVAIILTLASDDNYIKAVTEQEKCFFCIDQLNTFYAKILYICQNYIIQMLLLAVPVYFVLRIATYIISFGGSKVLNVLTDSQVKATALGSDAKAEAAIVAKPYPQWIKATRPPLPTGLANEISYVSNQAASQSIEKMRDALSTATIGEAHGDFLASLTQNLRGNELIHTTYFNIPRFRKLVAYAITQGDGFRPSAAFQADPDYLIVARFYDEIHGRVLPPPVPENPQLHSGDGAAHPAPHAVPVAYVSDGIR